MKFKLHINCQNQCNVHAKALKPAMYLAYNVSIFKIRNSMPKDAFSHDRGDLVRMSSYRVAQPHQCNEIASNKCSYFIYVPQLGKSII